VCLNFLNDVLNGPQSGIAGTHSGLHRLWLKRLSFVNINIDDLLIHNPLEHLQYVEASETACYKQPTSTYSFTS